ncbi:MAG: molecular chaperone DnaJ [Actinobacteria bacterium]|nr:molecular chaperone DnaJ [Actinomycetota bacterium]MDI6829929.1 molecular chaperone DnaJ [Actinomycetota bacterium]
MKDYYAILGVARDADQEQIKRAYRRLARRYHPDVAGGDRESEERFKEINEAYEVLGDPEKRHRYDLFGETGIAASPFERGFEGFGSPFGDIFNLFFGGGQGRARTASPRRGSDLLAVVEIELEEAYSGARREIEVPRHESCPECGGSGLEKGFGHDLCPDCGGEGRFTRTRRSAFGTFTSTTTCRRCGGSGEINTHPCGGCAGRGIREILDRVEVEIPAGVEDGDRIRMSGRGEAGQLGGPPGDLFVEVRTREHPVFTRHGRDLHAVVSVDMVEAALGAEVDIPTLDGEEKLHVPPGSQPGDSFRLRGRGMPEVHSRARGDLYLTLEVRIPRRLTAEQKRLLREFQRQRSRDEEAPGVMERLRKAVRQKA